MKLDRLPVSSDSFDLNDFIMKAYCLTICGLYIISKSKISSTVIATPIPSITCDKNPFFLIEINNDRKKNSEYRYFLTDLNYYIYCNCLNPAKVILRYKCELSEPVKQKIGYAISKWVDKNQ